MACFETNLQKYIHISKYARWIEKEKRRETWEESVARLMNFWRDKNTVGMGIGDAIYDMKILDDIEKAILACDIMPSMRGMMTAGKALERDNIALYNCTASAIMHPAIFSEAFYILMNGCGFGFSCERQYINQMPDIAEDFYESTTTLDIRDSKMGWATGLKELISMLYNGQIPKWDLSKIRPAGARLKTFGGRASGPEPLNKLFKHTVHLFTNAKGRKLSSIECHDLMCHIADTVIVGSVRRAALISLSNLTDDRMRRAKDGQWWKITPHRQLANNSVAYTEKPDLDSFSKEWRTLYKSKSGERGIWNKVSAKLIAEARGREYDGDYIPNPCGEVSLRDNGGVCNLTETIIRPWDSFRTICRKLRLATIMGTIQATLVDFRFLRKVWKRNCEEERLLGVSMTGIMDHPIFSNNANKDEYHEWSGGKATCLEELLDYFHDYVHKVNKEWAKKMGINPTGHVCVIKPSGTVSILTGTSSGIHPRYGEYYIRRVRNDKKDPLSQLMIDQGVPYVEEEDKYVFSFYVKSPEHSVIQKDIGAIKQLELWKIYKEHWCDGNPSQTIYYTDDDYFAIADWLWTNWDLIGGLSFFPVANIYENAPLEEITEEEYLAGESAFPKEIDWDRLVEFEEEDATTASQEFACAGGACELVDHNG